MRLSLKLLLVGAALTVGWCTLFSCSSLEGQVAPPLTGGTLLKGGFSVEDAEAPQTDWRLLAFFSPN